MIDLRSDTVTRPSREMLKAMMEAPTGDDVFKEDPTVNSLEERVSAYFGMESGLFCPSGTMSNQIAIKAHTQPGDELICDKSSHIYNYEAGGIAFHSGVQTRLIDGNLGQINSKQIIAAINDEQDWLARTSLVCLENTVNRAGGSVYDPDNLDAVSKTCREMNLGLHLDGARIFNAMEAVPFNPKHFGRWMDSVSVCFSKGLGCPVGSMLLGSSDFIKKARKIRKLMGGGMRQAGILAAAAHFALDNNIERLKEDHEHAAQIGACLLQLPWVESIFPVQSNIVLFQLTENISSRMLYEFLKENGVLISAFGGQSVRMVTHLEIDADGIKKVMELLQKFKPEQNEKAGQPNPA